MARRPIIITRWASQADRSRAPLQPDYVGIDERSLPELLAFAPAFARHVRYIAADDRPDGNWSDFFLADGPMVLASMAVFDAAEHSRRFREASQQVRLETSDALKLERLQAVFDVILALLREVDAWYAALEGLSQDADPDALRGQLASAISGELAPLLARLCGYGAGAGQPGGLGHRIAVDCRQFRPIWQTEFICADGSIYQGHSRRQKIDAALGPLAALYEFLLGAISDLVERARLDFAASLANGRVKPHIALYIAFVRQLQVAQGRLNELPARVVDFYYKEILREPLRPAAPDQVFLTFTRAPGIIPAKVSRGTPFPAGPDAAGQPVLFLADQTLNVERARLVRVRAIRTTRGPLHDASSRKAPALAADRLRRVNITNIPVAADGVLADGKPWAPFGTAAVGSADTMSQEAPMGFAIVSRSLLLTGGKRTLTVRMRCNPQFGHAVLDPLLQEIAVVTGLSAEQALIELLTKAFGFSVTSQAGWHEIRPCNITVSANAADGRSLSFQFKMDPGAPPLVAAEPLLAGAQFDAVRVPALLARLCQEPVRLSGNTGKVDVYPLSLLEGFPVEDVVIETCVTDLPGVMVKTRNGPVDATVPFLPFGAPARISTWFDIQHRELFTKPLKQLTVSIDWLGLPSHPRGFAGYYEQYVVGLDRQTKFDRILNDSFCASAKLAGDAPWTLSKDNKPADSLPLFLFRTKNERDLRDPPEPPGPQPSAPLVPTTRLEFATQPRIEAALPEAPGAALRITLTDPSFGFGDELYPLNVIYAVNHVQIPPPRRGRLCRLLDVLLGPAAAPPPPDVAAFYPNPPWQPEVASLSIGYNSTTRLNLQGADAKALLHLLPSGALQPATPDENGLPLLLPKAPEQAQLDLGFADLGVAQTLTVLFRMTGEGRDDDERGGVKWRARGAGGWIDLTADTDRRDGCDGLRHSGIVTLALPPMPVDARERLSWIRALPQRDPDSFPALLAITPHALTATRTVNAQAAPLSAIPPKTIKAAATALAGVATVDQPVASFGGREAETPATLPIRLGERLRHKARASLAWDHERLVLERFPDIARVRVLPARNAAGYPKPGELLVVAVQDPGLAAATDMLMPKIGVELRGRIQASLQAATSPFARVHVADPAYVRIAVQADIVFRTDAPDHGPTQLNKDLREFLSPWSSGLNLSDQAGPGEIRAALANFIASRTYVAGLVALELSYEPSLETFDWCVLTSAASHDIRIARPETVLKKLNSAVPTATEQATAISEAPRPRLPPARPWSLIPLS
ncbi:MAG: hypothetical protein QOD11_579 [Bradyrhizobium sp.]|nr:hypothetical protein [Bradyrhizobium sp.]